MRGRAWLRAYILTLYVNKYCSNPLEGPKLRGNHSYSSTKFVQKELKEAFGFEGKLNFE